MRFIYGLLSTLIGFLLLYLLKMSTGIEATSFSIFFIFPIGAIIFAYIMGMGYPLGVIKANKRRSNAQLLFVWIMAIATYVGIHYMYYRMTFLDADMVMNFKGNGDHISEFINLETNKQMTFWNFFVYKVNSMSISFTRRSLRTLAGPISFSFLNWVFMVIEFLGFVLVYTGIYTGTMEKNEFCEECEKYMKVKNITTITIHHNEKIKALLEAVEGNNLDAARELISQNPPAPMDSSSDVKFEGQLHYCPDCKKGFVSFDMHKKNSKGRHRQSESKMMKTPVSTAIVNGLM